MAYTNFQNCTASEYKNIVYNQETHNKIKILFNNVDYFNDDADEYCESFEVISRVIPNGSKTFMLENLVSQEATLILHNIDTSIIQDQVSISIGTLVSENTYEYVPIGIYNIQELPTTDNGKTTIKLRDNSVKLDFNYNAKPLIDEHGGTATKLQILQDICTKAGITCNVSSFIGSSDLIGIYDNTITGRQYVAYLAGSAGAKPIITRTGALDFKYINNLSIIEIPIEIVEKYTNAENFKISRIVYEDGIRKYEHGNETYDTLFLDSANPYVSSQSQVDSIYNIVNNFEINSFTTGSILGNPAIDSYDLIQITDYDNTVFKTFANNTLRYNGKMINTFASEISFERKKENVSLNSTPTFKRWAKTEIDNANAQITLQAGQIDGIENELSTPTSTKENKYFDLEDALDEPLIDFKMYGNTSQSGTPTPSSPQEIHNVSGDNTIEICGKNLFSGFFRDEEAGGTYENNTYTSTTRTGANTWAFKKQIEPNTSYVISYGTKTNAQFNYFLSNNDYNSSATIVAQTSTAITNTTIVNNTNNKYLYMIFRTTTSGTTATLSNVMVEKGSTSSEYEAYTGNSQLISLGVENLFDKDNANYINAYINVSTMKFALSSTVKTYYISCKPNTTYTISKTLTAQFRVGTSASTPVVDGTLLQAWNNNSATQYTITTDSQAKYLCICVRNSSSDTKTEEEVLASVQIEKGSKVNSYSEYGKPYIELNKISTYQDYIYKDNDRWFLHKEIGKQVLVGTENWKSYSASPNYVFYIEGSIYHKGSASDNPILCDKFIPNFANTDGSIYLGGSNRLAICTSITTELSNWKTWLASNNIIVYFALSTPTDTEITSDNYPVLLEQLNNLMTLPLYKNLTHITLTPNDLQPTMKIEYYRDTDINNNYLPKQEIDNYYTKVETNAQIQISSNSISSEVVRVEAKTDNNNGLISGLDEKITTNQSSNVFEINALKKTIYEDGVEMLENSLVKIDVNGINVSKTNENFNTQITNKTFEIRDGTRELALIGYDSQENRTVARMDDIESKRATIGVHRCETIGTGANKRTAWFYVGGDN